MDRFLGAPDMRLLPGHLNVSLTTPDPPPNWRRISPVDAGGTGTMLLYGQELAQLASGLSGFYPGCTVNADYRRINGEWFPIPESVRVVR